VTFDRGLYVVTATLTTIADSGCPALVGFPGSAPVCESVRFCTDRLSDADVVRGSKALARAFVERSQHRSHSLSQKLDRKKYLMAQSVENALFDFHHKTPKHFGKFFS